MRGTYKTNLEIQKDGFRTVCQQACEPELYPWDPYDGRRETATASSDHDMSAVTQVLTDTHRNTHTKHTKTKQTNVLKKRTINEFKKTQWMFKYFHKNVPDFILTEILI